jgi:glucokinase
MTKTAYLLTADVGGTNSRMGLYSVDDCIPLVVKYYRNQDYLTAKKDGIFEKNVVAPFLQHCWESNSNLVSLDQVEIIACLAIAGPVRNNSVFMSNLHNIVIDGNAIAKQLHCPNEPYLSAIKVCKIINDFVAQGYGCLTLTPEELRELNPGSLEKMDPTGPKVCVGAGTGLGECFLTPDGEGVYTCFASEGGHVEWAPRNELEIKLWKYLKEKFKYKNRISVERVVSGPGLANVYEFLAQEFPDQVDKKIHEEFEKAGDMQGKVVAVNSKEGTLCAQAMEIMMG